MAETTPSTRASFSIPSIISLIAAEAQASPTTVVRVARFLKEMPHQGYRLVLDRFKS